LALFSTGRKFRKVEKSAPEVAERERREEKKKGVAE